jgi:membrane-bound serine protease (ClpP class)
MAPAGSGPVWVITLANSINPGSAEILAEGLKQAAQDDAACVVLMIDTPGGLERSMRAMVRAVLASPVPVVCYVAPSGARAASAGAFLVLAGAVAAMAPATNLGAAHPVGPGGSEIKGPMADKVVNDLVALATSLAKRRGRDPAAAARMVTDSASYDAAQARRLGLVDVVARDLGTLLKALEGRMVETSAGPRRITSQGRALHYYQPDWRLRLLAFLASPDLAYILLMIGLMGLYFELSQPGAIFPGVIGGICLILALFAMSTLPVSYTGLALIGLGVVLFVLEIKVASAGLLSLGGAVCLVLGSVMLFESDQEMIRVSLNVLVPTVGGVVAFFAVVTWLAVRAQLRQAITGREGLVGAKGVMVASDRVRVMGELWRAKSHVPLEAGQEVKVLAVEGLELTVAPLPPPEA